MADPHGPPVVTKARDVMTWILDRVSGFPRTHRFVLGERVGNLAVDVLESLLEDIQPEKGGGASEVQSEPGKTAALAQVGLRVEVHQPQAV